MANIEDFCPKWNASSLLENFPTLVSHGSYSAIFKMNLSRVQHFEAIFSLFFCAQNDFKSSCTTYGKSKSAKWRLNIRNSQIGVHSQMRVRVDFGLQQNKNHIY